MTFIKVKSGEVEIAVNLQNVTFVAKESNGRIRIYSNAGEEDHVLADIDYSDFMDQVSNLKQ